MPVCWNWQTRWTQNPLPAMACGFDPRHRHHNVAAKARPPCPPQKRGAFPFCSRYKAEKITPRCGTC